jgi:hypothetical protein
MMDKIKVLLLSLRLRVETRFRDYVIARLEAIIPRLVAWHDAWVLFQIASATPERYQREATSRYQRENNR